MKIIHVISQVGDGGDWTFLRALIQEQIRNGNDVCVFGQWATKVSHQFGDLCPKLFEFEGSPKKLGCIKSWNQLRKVAADKTSQGSVIHCHSFSALLFSWLGKLWHQCPIVLTIHLVPPLRRIPQLFRKLSVKLSRPTLVVPSDKAAHSLAVSLSIPVEKFQVIHCGVNTQRFSKPTQKEKFQARQEFGLLEKDCVFGFAGRLDEEKRVDWLLKAMARLEPESGARALIAGRGPCLDQLRNLAKNLEIENRVQFVGRLTDTAPFFRACDVVVLPSAHETFGLATAEAMLMNIPIVRSRTSGWECQIVEGETGYSFDVNDRKTFEENLAKLVKSPEKRKQMGDSARRHAESRFSMIACEKKHNTLYQTMKNNNS